MSTLHFSAGIFKTTHIVQVDAILAEYATNTIVAVQQNVHEVPTEVS